MGFGKCKKKKKGEDKRTGKVQPIEGLVEIVEFLCRDGAKFGYKNNELKTKITLSGEGENCELKVEPVGMRGGDQVHKLNLSAEQWAKLAHLGEFNNRSSDEYIGLDMNEDRVFAGSGGGFLLQKGDTIANIDLEER